MNGNRFMSLILRSPFHKMLGSSFMLITVTGCKTGKAITTPVNFARDGNKLWVTSYRNRNWWRNLRGGRPVSLRIEGKEISGWGNTIEDRAGVERALSNYLKILPQYAKYYDVSIDQHGEPLADQIAQAAQDRVMVEITL